MGSWLLRAYGKVSFSPSPLCLHIGNQKQLNLVVTPILEMPVAYAVASEMPPEPRKLFGFGLIQVVEVQVLYTACIPAREFPRFCRRCGLLKCAESRTVPMHRRA